MGAEKGYVKFLLELYKSGRIEVKIPIILKG